uniref:WD_REPEATS_REGION domain-containing protein n=2 Tax=Macrostomum lignano TaxID=282301 RepID=A0A1I8HBI5_9PLAT
MKIKQIQRTSVATWSPGNQQPLLLAAGTSAHQLDATFSTSSVLELFKVDLTSPDTELKPSASIETADRFCRLMWGSHGVDADLPWGVLVGGTARGKLVVYNPERLATESSESAEVFTQSGHTGSVGALDLNPFQKNLLCTGGGESEIFVWDLANPSAQMAPGSKSLPADDVLGVAWNRQVSHILGSVFATRCIVWDLKKSEPIIKLTDSMCQMRLKHVVWHPKVATQLCLASDDDQTPLVQMWDLRYATSPMQQLNAHTKGILSMAWSPFDPDYLLSTSRDSSLICWDPNCSSPGGEIVVKATLPNRWIYDSAWSPKHPLLLCASSMDGQLSVLNILGGSDGEDSSAPAAAADNAANSASGSADPFAQVHQPSVPAQVWYHPGKAPKWMRPRCGARFGFGGRLVSFGCDAASDASGQQQQNRQAKISQVVTEPELVRRAGDLERALSAGAADLGGHCRARAEAAKDEAEQRLWQFLETNFSSDPRTQFLKLLGFEADEEGEAVSEKGEDKSEAEGGEAETDEFSAIAEEAKPLGLASATEDGAEDADLTKALIAGRIEIAVNLCLDKGRLAEAAILAVAGGAELYERTQARLFRLLNTDTGRLIRAVVTHACPYVVQHSGNEDWRHSLAFALTYASAEEFAELAEQVGRRLETDGRRQEAALCYICAGSVPRLAACLMPAGGEPRPLLLQDVVEKAEVLRLAVTDADHPSSAGDLGALTAHLGSYAEQLANQGELRAALRYLQPAAVAGDSNQTARAHRLYQALGCPPDVPAPPNPYRPTVAAASAVVNGGYRPVAGQQQQPRQQLPGKPQSGSAAPSNPYAVSSVTSQQQQQQQQQPAAMYNPAANLYQPTSYAANRTNPPYPAYAAPPVQPVQSAYQPVGNTMYQPGQPPATSMYQPPPPPTATGYQPHSMLQQQQHPPPPPPSSSQYPTKPRDSSTKAGCGGWNDPPFLSEQKKPSDSAAQAPPPPANLYNPAAYVAQHPPGLPQPPHANPLTAPPPISQMPTANVPPSPHDKVKHPSGGGRRSRNTSMCSDKGSDAAGASAAAAAATASQPAVLPDQFKHFPRVLGDLVGACRLQSAATSRKRQVTVKMDDVERKLAALYELLAQNKLSQPVLDGLTAIVQNLQQKAMQEALGWVNHVIQSANFAEIRTFMPGVKVLVQTAIEVGVTP